MIFGNIRGHAFLDVGAAWDSSDEFSTNKWPDRYGNNVSGNYSPGFQLRVWGLKST